MIPVTCPACGKRRGSNAECQSCRDAAARELANEARDVTHDSLGARAKAALRFGAAPPWYGRFAPKTLFRRLKLLGMLLEDYVRGSYRKIPWRSVAAVAAAAAYVVSPLDLIPDFLIPVGWTDDLLVVAIAWMVVKGDLRTYCAWKGLSPAQFEVD
jgi:uncharacterized membrane protein YkvA (DUF1232 family)